MSSDVEVPAPKRPKISETPNEPVNVMIGGEETIRGRKSFVAPSQKLHYGDYPLKIVRSKGQYLWDENGQQYLDTFNNVSHVGHCNDKVVKICCAQMSILNTNSRFLNDKIVTYAKHLCSKFPKSLSCCFFTNSESEANDLALQIALVVTGKTHIIGLEGAYHGHLMSLNQLSTHKPGKGPCAPGPISMVPIPDSYRGQYTDPDTAGKYYAEDFIKIVEGKQVATFIHESILSCAGQVVPPKGYFETIYKYIHSIGGLCIADEVQTGFGRLGEHFWGFESHDVCPDIVTLGKPMGNGHPVAAVVTTKEIADKFAACGIEYFNTFGGNPVSMATAEAVLSVVEDEQLQSHAQEMGDYLKTHLEALKEKYPCIGDVRGSGLFLGVDFVKDTKSKEPDPNVAQFVVKHMLIDHQIIVLADRLYDNVIKIKPPMVVTQDDCSSIVKGLDQVLSKHC